MAFPKTLPILAACLGLTACGMLPGNTDTDAAQNEVSETAPEPFLETISSPELTVGTSAPGQDYRKTGTSTQYAQVNCPISSRRKAGVEELVTKLRDEAANDNADYLHVRGTGPLYRRGICEDRILRLSGAVYQREQAQTPSSTATREAPGTVTTDSLSNRLEELEGLRDRGLLNQNEYEQLRERVLDEAY